MQGGLLSRGTDVVVALGCCGVSLGIHCSYSGCGFPIPYRQLKNKRIQLPDSHMKVNIYNGSESITGAASSAHSTFVRQTLEIPPVLAHYQDGAV